MALDSFSSLSASGSIDHKHIPISSGSNELVAAVAGKRIAVYRYMLSGDATVRYLLHTGAHSIFEFFGMEYFGVPLLSEGQQLPIFVSNAGEALTLTASGVVNANVYIQYKIKG